MVLKEVRLEEHLGCTQGTHKLLEEFGRSANRGGCAQFVGL